MTAPVGPGARGDQPTTVGIIGPGRVGTALAMAASAAGLPVVAVAGSAMSSSATLERFTRLVPTATPMPATRLAASAELVLLTIGDDQIAPRGPRRGGRRRRRAG